ncbi:DUF5688 family protein [Faecalimonas sp.]
MTYSQFVAAVKKELECKLEKNTKIDVHIALKNNNTERRGLAFVEEGINISPTIYLEEIYKEFQEGKKLDEIVQDILEVYGSTRVSQKWEIESLNDFAKTRKKILCKLINQEKNKEFLEDTPYISFLDLAIVCYVLIELKENGIVTMPVKFSQLEMWGIEETELFQVAKENVQKQFPAELRQMKEVIAEMLGIDMPQDDEEVMYVLSNDIRSFGAICIIYDGILELIGEELKENYYIIPSSIHEMIIVPESKAPKKEEIEEMVKEINETQVENEEVLSNNVYFYNIQEKRMS